MPLYNSAFRAGVFETRRVGHDLRARLDGALAARLQTGKSRGLADMLVARDVLASNHSIT